MASNKGNVNSSKDEAEDLDYDQIDMASAKFSKADHHRRVTSAVMSRLLNGKFKHLASVG